MAKDFRISVGNINHERFGRDWVELQLPDGARVSGILERVVGSGTDVVVSVRGVPVPLTVPWGTSTEVVERGTEKYPIKFHWEKYKPEYLGLWCEVRGVGGETRVGLLEERRVSHSRRDGKVLEYVSFHFSKEKTLIVKEII